MAKPIFMLSPLERYKNTIDYIHQNFKDEIDIEVVESISCYSYRNINRIFSALHQETIGKYVKRLRIEKAAEYLKYSDHQISDIALEVGFGDIAAFSKAFKRRFKCSPLAFRRKDLEAKHPLIDIDNIQNTENPIAFDIESLPEFNYLFFEHRGDYSDIKSLEKSWRKFLTYTYESKLLTDQSIVFSELFDDTEISHAIHCRTNLGLIIDPKLNFKPKELFNIGWHKPQKYAKFTHVGSPETIEQTYNKIYASWIYDIQLEFEDKPTLEFYINHEDDIPSHNYITELYIPVK